MHLSGSVVTSPGILETGVSMAIDKKRLQASLLLSKTKVRNHAVKPAFLMKITFFFSLVISVMGGWLKSLPHYAGAG